MSEREECPCCHQDIVEETDEDKGCGGYGVDYAPGTENCDWCPVRDVCAVLSRGDN